MKLCVTKKTGAASIIHPLANFLHLPVSVKLQIKVIPSSSEDCIAGWLEGTLKVKVKAPSDKGKANKAVINVLEKSLELAKGSVTIESGHTSSRKIVVFNVTNEAIIKKQLESY